MPTFRLSGHSIDLDHDSVEAAVADEYPEPLDTHYVVISGRRFPPKQVLAKVTGVDRADFHSHHARRILMRLGFTAGRVGENDQDQADDDRSGGPHGGRQAAALTPFVGKWVALAGPTTVLVAADTPEQVLAWLSRHEQRAPYGMFKVPDAASWAEGLAPE